MCHCYYPPPPMPRVVFEILANTQKSLGSAMRILCIRLDGVVSYCSTQPLTRLQQEKVLPQGLRERGNKILTQKIKKTELS